MDRQAACTLKATKRLTSTVSTQTSTLQAADPDNTVNPSGLVPYCSSATRPTPSSDTRSTGNVASPSLSSERCKNSRFKYVPNMSPVSVTFDSASPSEYLALNSSPTTSRTPYLSAALLRVSASCTRRYTSDSRVWAETNKPLQTGFAWLTGYVGF